MSPERLPTVLPPGPPMGGVPLSASHGWAAYWLTPRGALATTEMPCSARCPSSHDR